jgi:hypothetical protein
MCSAVAASGKPWLRRLASGCALLLGAATVCWLVLREPPEPPEPSFAENQQRCLLPQPAVVDVPVKPLAEVKDRLAAADLVLGIVLGKESRAYPIDMLNLEPRRKVLNDVLDGQPIAVTWCDACHSGIVYSRAVAGQVLVLAVDGRLWNESLVMYDPPTHSLWSQLQGEAKQGKWAGTRLRALPSVVTDWQSWTRTHPESTVAWFDGRTREFNTAMYADPKRFVLGIAEGRRARGWTFAELFQHGAINDTWAGQPVVALLERSHVTARLYHRQVADRTLSFHLEERGLVDRETGTTWEPDTGRAVSGPLAGECLKPLPAATAFREVWLRFYPRSVR